MAEPPPNAPDKAAWRSWLMKRRLCMHPQERRQAEQRMADALSTHATLEGWTRVAVFLPWKAEPDLVSLWRAWHARGIALGLPVVAQRDAPMHFRPWVPGQPMLQDLMGLPVPQPMQPEAFDVWILPCVGIDASGARIGAGKGYYDRTLAAHLRQGGQRPRLVGVSYAAGLVPMALAEPHDLRLDDWVTEISGQGR